MSASHEIASGGLAAVVSSAGAELVSLRDEGRELLWGAGPEWPRHAPVLFPVVGKLKGDALRHDGRAYGVGQHGFARDRPFVWTERSAARAALTLSDDAWTRERFPFAFRLDMTFEIGGDALSVTSRVANPGREALPFAIGAHPGFRWPLADGVDKRDHVLEFGTRETGARRTVEDGLLGPEAPLPFDGRTLRLDEALFARDALVLPAARSRSVRYRALGPNEETLRALEISWEGYRDLGVWSAPGGAPFLCVEPWAGMASDVGWDGPFVEKPGLTILPPGAEAVFAWRVRLLPRSAQGNRNPSVPS